jgi:acyl-coenzyme A thioesterase PaaI-like protein
MDPISRVRRAYGDACFACGPSNPIGLHLGDFRVGEDGEVTARFLPRPEYRGAGDTLHGGIAATALDEVLVWAGILTHGVVTVTGSLEIRYRRPLTVGDHWVEARGRVDERRGRRLIMSGSLCDREGPAVEGRGLYLVSAEVDRL